MNNKILNHTEELAESFLSFKDAPSPIPYEMHISIKNPGINSFGINLIDNFIVDCKELGVKPIVLDLENSGENVMKDIMTSSHFFGNNLEAYIESNRIKEHILEKGYEVLRVKIETVPWHPAAPVTANDKMPKDCYFEAHIGCIISLEEKNKLQNLAKSFNAHLSKNTFKKIEDGKFVNMVTLRNYDCTCDWFTSEVERFKNLLNKENVLFEKVEIEFCIYDTKISHDYLWLK